jgi:predicted nuclease of restriction endonuclease-like (RecB) superfamily
MNPTQLRIGGQPFELAGIVAHRTFYVLEFLGLKDKYHESQQEETLIQHLQKFLLELGIGFTFVTRQKRGDVQRRKARASCFFQPISLS